MIKGKNAARKILSKPAARYTNSSKTSKKTDNCHAENQNENEAPGLRVKLQSSKRSNGSIMSIANLIRSSGKFHNFCC